MTVKYRLYREKNDYNKIRGFLEESISISGPDFYFGLGDFDFCVALNSSPDYLDNIDEILKDVHLWLDENDKMLGGIWPSENIVNMFIHPDEKGLFDEMVSAGESFVRQSLGEKTKTDEIEWWIFDGDEELENVLMQRGYHKTDLYRPHRVFDCSAQISQLQLPEGYVIRSFSEVQDKSIYPELYKKYFGITLKESALSSFTHTPTYREELDLVITAPDETIAAFCTIRYDEKNRLGTFEPVACHPDHKCKGLSKAIMLEGLKRARDLGANMVTIQTSDPKRNLAANRLYDSVGFRKVKDLYFWRKKIY